MFFCRRRRRSAGENALYWNTAPHIIETTNARSALFLTIPAVVEYCGVIHCRAFPSLSILYVALDSILFTALCSHEMFVCCLTSQQQASVSQGRICSDNFTCCHTEIEVADPTFHLTQSQYTDTGPTSPSADPITPGAWQGSHWSASFEVTGVTRPRKIPCSSGIRTRDLPLSRRTPSY